MLRTRSQNRRSKSRRTLVFDNLESRQVLSVSSLWFSGATLVVKTDNAATSVNVSQVGSNAQIQEVSSGRTWSYASSSVGTVEFQGGAGNDRFVDYVYNLPIRAFGSGGNDYLEGWNAADYFDGGDGNDQLVGYGGDDLMFGGPGNDVLLGMDGNDQLVGGDGDDRCDGGVGNDSMWGQNGNDVLLGGDGNDQLVGGDGDDHLNGGAGSDSMWGQNGNDVLIALDNVLTDYVEGDAGRNILWVDKTGSSTDSIYGATSSDKVQYVTGFANGADRTLNGDRLADPTVKSGHTYKMFSGNPLFSSAGPQASDIRQQQLGDCYLMAGLAAIANDDAFALRQNVVDFDDGTYGVRLKDNFYRVDNDLPVDIASFTRPVYADLGAQNSMWPAIVEKAWATGLGRVANSYASIEGGGPAGVNEAFGAIFTSDREFDSYANATALANDISYHWNCYDAVTVGFYSPSSGVPLIGNHVYTVMYVTCNLGVVTSITLRNPWGVDGAGHDSNPYDGLVTVTPDQLFGSGGFVVWGHV